MGKSKAEKGKGSERPKGANGKGDARPLEVLTLEVAAALLRVSVEGLKADAEKGVVPGGLIGGEWRFSHPALLAWLTVPRPVAPNARQLSAIGSMVDDDTLPAMVEEIYRRRTEE